MLSLQSMNFLSELFGEQKNNDNFFLLAGPCAVEGEEICLSIAEKIKGICESVQIPFAFKASYRKANRSSISSFTGIGDDKALQILQKVKDTYQVPIVTDIHTDEEASKAATVADVLQIPAFLCRQTSLLQAAAKTGKVVNIKKGQFLNAQSMAFAAKKVSDSGNQRVMLTERGTTFGYEDLVVDYRSIPIMQETGYPVLLDCTHALQKPNQSSGVTSGQPEFIETLAKCGIVAGANGLFIETHPDPQNAKSDGANMLNLSNLEPLIQKLVTIKKAL
jgi:2-dehydro-3-deoxyphosphooctonate aldolase (KDO 8-P synthase)